MRASELSGPSPIRRQLSTEAHVVYNQIVSRAEAFMKGGLMPRCFVIQPFDKGPFDKRYDDVFVPAIEKAALEPYRVDRDASASVLIENIERHIQDSEMCLADISLDNPNVWYEVGFAIASGKEVILVCSEEKATAFPFDVRHRSILTYTTHSPRDFEKLGVEITARLKLD